jgi:hypothetical protein
MTRPRAADDFAVIRARLEELRRERAQVSAAPDARPLGPPPPSPLASGELKPAAPRPLPPATPRTFRN